MSDATTRSPQQAAPARRVHFAFGNREGLRKHPRPEPRGLLGQSRGDRRPGRRQRSGKSTLIKIISGVLQPTEGTITVEGKQIRFDSSKVAMDHGIETIYQDMNLIDVMDITRNIFCGREETNRLGFLKTRSMKEKAMSVLEKEITIEGIRAPGQRVGHLSGRTEAGGLHCACHVLQEKGAPPRRARRAPFPFARPRHSSTTSCGFATRGCRWSS